jgi:hypothetical protein
MPITVLLANGATMTVETIFPAGSVGYLQKEFFVSDRNTCLSHEHIDNSIRRQEEILQEIRRDNANHREKMSALVAEICTQLKTIQEIKTTQVDNMRRREDFAQACEEKREEIWVEINGLKQRQGKKDGSMLILAAVCTSVGSAAAWLITWLQKH